METQQIDKLYLELSQFTKATTEREQKAINRADRIMNIIIHGEGTEVEKMQSIYNAAREIYETVSRKPHYWHTKQVGE